MSRLRRKTLLMLTLGVSLAFPAVAFAADQVVKRFTGGTGPHAVGIVEASEDTETHVPQALYAGEDGELFILDQVNGRVLQFDPKQPAAQPRAMRLPSELEPTDLVVMKGDILVWDGELHALRAKRREADAPGTRGVDDGDEEVLEEVSTRG
ncbi:MAG TPA: hypothetical protein VKB15_03800, partial [Xanthobacteraceae bacterium]|nr:hypothetical protein [Xanthobacteraceae bacterium]